MERITKNIPFDQLDLTEELGYSWIYQRLQQLENDMESGKLRYLPFNINETVYVIVPELDCAYCEDQEEYCHKNCNKKAMFNKDVIKEGKISDIHISGSAPASTQIIVTVPRDKLSGQYDRECVFWGRFLKNICKSKEEAEKRLKEKQEEEF
jgi:hypothetical protein